MSPAELDTDFRTNVHGTLGVIKAFLPVLERAPGGATIVNVVSLGALASVPSFGGYSASKAAAYSVTQALRPAELRAKHIDILAVLPSPIDTDMVKALQLPKTSPADVAKGVIAGIARGEEDIFPDPMAQQTADDSSYESRRSDRPSGFESAIRCPTRPPSTSDHSRSG